MGYVTDIRPPSPRYRDRTAAARRLAACLAPYRERRPLVLGIPPGGAAMAETVARELGGDLDVALVRALVSPGGGTLGAVAEGGSRVLSAGWRAVASPSYVEAAAADALKEIDRHRDGFTPRSSRRNPAERLAILVDDGTSCTPVLTAAILSIREAGARSVIAASAVAAIETAEALRRESDVVIVLRTLEPFTAAASCYEEFAPRSDSEIRESLKRAWRKPFTRGGG